jgi:hypothetical protein
MSNFRFKRTGNLWQVQKRRNFFWWDDLKIKSITIQVKTFKEAFYTLESAFKIKVLGVIEKPGAQTVPVIYEKEK